MLIFQHNYNYGILLLASLSFCCSVVSATSTKCLSTAVDLQKAIDQLPQGQQHGGIPELLLCSGIEPIQVSTPIRVHQRTVRIGCATTSDKELCTLQGTEESRLLEVMGTENAFDTFTVELSQLRLDSGASYMNMNVDPSITTTSSSQNIGGAAVTALGANLVVEDCSFSNNVASQKGGALHVQDQGRPILFVVSNTVFQDNLSVEDDCSSIYFQQQHPMTMADLNMEKEFGSTSTKNNRRLALDQWDDPAMAAQALQHYKPKPGATLCF